MHPTQPPVELRRLSGTPDELATLQRVLDGAPTYHHRLQGAPAGPDEARATLGELPTGKTLEDKLVYGVYADGEMVGCADVIRGWPRAETAIIGLLLFAERHQRRGFGARAYAELERIAREWGMTRMRIAVLASNAEVLPFWEGRGFRPTGERKPHRAGTAESELWVFEKPLAGA